MTTLGRDKHFLSCWMARESTGNQRLAVTRMSGGGVDARCIDESDAAVESRVDGPTSEIVIDWVRGRLYPRRVVPE
jgi:hypothetical protein